MVSPNYLPWGLLPGSFSTPLTRRTRGGTARRRRCWSPCDCRCRLYRLCFLLAWGISGFFVIELQISQSLEKLHMCSQKKSLRMSRQFENVNKDVVIEEKIDDQATDYFWSSSKDQAVYDQDDLISLSSHSQQLWEKKQRKVGNFLLTLLGNSS